MKKIVKHIISFCIALGIVVYYYLAWMGFQYDYPKKGVLFGNDGSSKLFYSCTTSLDDLILRSGLRQCVFHVVQFKDRSSHDDDNGNCVLVSRTYSKNFRFFPKYKTEKHIWIDDAILKTRKRMDDHARFTLVVPSQSSKPEEYWSFLEHYRPPPQVVPKSREDIEKKYPRRQFLDLDDARIQEKRAAPLNIRCSELNFL